MLFSPSKVSEGAEVNHSKSGGTDHRSKEKKKKRKNGNRINNKKKDPRGKEQ